MAPVDRNTRGVVFGLSAACLFGASTPIAKRLLDEASPQVLAGLLYLGAFAALLIATAARRRSPEARLRRADVPRLSCLVIAGGVLAPVAMLLGLDRVSGTTGSLLLNLEGPFTVLLGVIVFGEFLGRRGRFGAMTIFLGAALLSLGGGGGDNRVGGVLLIAAAAALWAIDNNLTQSLTTRDPFAIVTVKAGVAAGVNLTLAALTGADRPAAAALFAALLVGALAFGVSVVLDAYALRLLGAAREASIFAVSPFVGAVLAVPLLDEHLDVAVVVAAVLMVLGLWLLLRENHDHVHRHDLQAHDHVHVHDEHHLHDHSGAPEPGVPHSHPHRHGGLVHAHRHVSDAHHRHPHAAGDDS